MLILRSPFLVAFDSVARLGTVHAAAKELGITQTAVSLRLKQLESRLGMTLFLRSRRGMAPTSEGQSLILLCRGQRELEGRFLSQVSGDHRENISLTIVGPTSAVSTRVVKETSHLYSEYPFLNLHLRTDDHSDLIQLIRLGDADLAIVPPEQVPNEMDSKLLKPDRYLLVASKKWKGKKLPEILKNERLIDFHESDTTTERYLKTFGLNRTADGLRVFANNNEILIHHLKAGVGYATLTETVAKPYLASGDLITLNAGRSMEDPLALTWYPRPERRDYFKNILSAIR